MRRILLGIAIVVLAILVNSYLLESDAPFLWIGGILAGLFLIITGVYTVRKDSPLTRAVQQLSHESAEIISKLTRGARFEALAESYRGTHGVDKDYCIMFLAHLTRGLLWDGEESSQGVGQKIAANQIDEAVPTPDEVIDVLGNEEGVYLIGEKFFVSFAMGGRETTKDGVVILSRHFLFFFAYSFWRIEQGIMACIDEWLPFGSAFTGAYEMGKQVCDFTNYLRPERIARLKALFRNRYSFAVPLAEIRYVGPQFAGCGGKNRVRLTSIGEHPELYLRHDRMDDGEFQMRCIDMIDLACLAQGNIAENGCHMLIEKMEELNRREGGTLGVDSGGLSWG